MSSRVGQAFLVDDFVAIVVGTDRTRSHVIHNITWMDDVCTRDDRWEEVLASWELDGKRLL